jgi:hypothetical protein
MEGATPRANLPRRPDKDGTLFSAGLSATEEEGKTDCLFDRHVRETGEELLESFSEPSCRACRPALHLQRLNNRTHLTFVHFGLKARDQRVFSHKNKIVGISYKFN